MNQKNITRYKRLYQTAQRMGAAELLTGYLGLDDDCVVPLSVSHGVDFGQLREPIDVWRPEPIHWSYNQDLHAQAAKHKPSILLPHPWTIHAATADKPPSNETRTLIIGPPASERNDETLFDILKSELDSSWSILIKNRGNESRSHRFWEEQGVCVVSAGGEDSRFYPRLYSILAQYDSIVGCTFSSAVVFAASIGKSIRLLENYTYRVFDLPRYVEMADHSSERAKNTVSIFINRNRDEVSQHSRMLLGFELLEERDTLKENYDKLIESNEDLLYSENGLPFLKPLLARAALWLDRPGAVHITPKLILDEAINRKIIAKEINEISCWIDGPSEKNYRTKSIAYKKNKHRGGMGF